MFDVSSPELLLLGAVAIAVIPPKDLPRAMRFAGQWIGKARGMARHFRSGLDEMIRQAELEEIEKKWREENERIMREHPLHDAIEHPAEPAALPAPTDDMIEEPAPTEAMAEPAPPMAGSDDAAPPAAPAIVESATEIPAEPVSEPAPKRAAKAAPAEGDDGPELPFDLPPRQ